MLRWGCCKIIGFYQLSWAFRELALRPSETFQSPIILCESTTRLERVRHCLQGSALNLLDKYCIPRRSVKTNFPYWKERIRSARPCSSILLFGRNLLFTDKRVRLAKQTLIPNSNQQNKFGLTAWQLKTEICKTKFP